MIRDNENDLRLRLFKFFQEYYVAMGRFEGDFQNEIFDYHTVNIFTMLLSQAFKNEAEGKGFHARISRTEFSRKLRKSCSGWAVRRRLQLLARYWFLSINSTARRVDANGKWVRETQVIHPNEAFRIIFEPRQTHFKKNFIKRSLVIGEYREKDHQGLTITVPFGFPETQEFKIEDLYLGETFAKDTEKKKQELADKREERETWRKYNDAFITASANLWRFARSRSGYGNDLPVWLGSNLAPSAKNQRNELIKIFESWGGAVASLSWYIFVCGAPQLDDQGNPIFDLTIPHRQFKGCDYKPSSYVKHFNAILEDKDFKILSKEQWNEFKEQLQKFYGELLEIGPRAGNSYAENLGYMFGDIEKAKFNDEEKS